MSLYSKAISLLCPNANFSVKNNEIFLWDSPEIPRPSDEEIVAKVAELQADYDSKKYQRDRKFKYPNIQEQLDMQYWDAVNGTTTWKDAITKIKTDNPKPT